MKYFVSALILVLFSFEADAAKTGRPAMSNHIISAPRYTASVNQLNGKGNAIGSNVLKQDSVVEEEPEEDEEPVQEEPVQEEEPEIDMREAERNACISNNIGVGNTFVWASKYSNTDSYTTMVEDVEHPENNVCFVRVELNSTNESRIKVADIAPKYFMWDETIKCGSWVSKKEMEKRILEARKGARIGGIVATTVGGMGLGVGAMELFGNKLIGGKVEGQKGVKEKELYKQQLLAMKKKNDTEYRNIKDPLKVLNDDCNGSNSSIPVQDCELYQYLYKAIAE